MHAMHIGARGRSNLMFAVHRVNDLPAAEYEGMQLH